MSLKSIKSLMSGALVASVFLVVGCSDDLGLMDKETVYYGLCHNIIQLEKEGAIVPVLRADAVFMDTSHGGSEMKLQMTEDGLQADLTGCDAESMVMFDQPIAELQGPSGRVINKVIR